MAKRKTGEEQAKYTEMVGAKLRMDMYLGIKEALASKLYWWRGDSDLIREAIEMLLARIAVENPGIVDIDRIHALAELSRDVIKDIEYSASLHVVEQAVLKEHMPNEEYDDAWRITKRAERIVNGMPNGIRKRKYQHRVQTLIELIKTYPGAHGSEPDQEVMGARPSEAQEVE